MFIYIYFYNIISSNRIVNILTKFKNKIAIMKEIKLFAL